MGKPMPRFEVEVLEGDITVQRCEKSEAGLVMSEVTEPAGWMVYFPNGHSIRVRTEKELRRLGFHRQPGLVDLQEGEVLTEDGDEDGVPSLKQLVARSTATKRRAPSQSLEG